MENNSFAQIYMPNELPDLQALVEQWRKQGSQIHTTNGIFDIFHAGHADFLGYCYSQDAKVIVGINSDDSASTIKRVPIQDQWKRAYVVACHYAVDAVYIFNDLEPSRWLDRLKPDKHFKDLSYQDKMMPEAATVMRHGGQVWFVPIRWSISTSEIIERISQIHVGDPRETDGEHH